MIMNNVNICQKTISMIMRNKTPLPLDSGDLPCRKNNNPVSSKSQKFSEESGKKNDSNRFFLPP